MAKPKHDGIDLSPAGDTTDIACAIFIRLRVKSKEQSSAILRVVETLLHEEYEKRAKELAERLRAQEFPNLSQAEKVH